MLMPVAHSGAPVKNILRTGARPGRGRLRRATLASTQVEYSLLNRDVEPEIIPAAQALGLGVLPWSPLGRGVLTGKYRRGTPADSRAASPHFSNFVEHYLTERTAGVVEAVARAADGLGWSPLQVALVWVRDRPGVTAPIVGARTAASSNARMVGWSSFFLSYSRTERRVKMTSSALNGRAGGVWVM